MLNIVSAICLVNTFGSALAIIYAYNASNTSGHTKKVRYVRAVPLVHYMLTSFSLQSTQ